MKEGKGHKQELAWSNPQLQTHNSFNIKIKTQEN